LKHREERGGFDKACQIDLQALLGFLNRQSDRVGFVYRELGDKIIRRLAKRDIGREFEEILRPNFEGWTPEKEGFVFPRLLRHLGQVGNFTRSA
jgi:hypothetical protein